MNVRQVESERELRLGDILAACVEAVEDGRPVHEVIARYPEFLPELRQFFATRAHIDRIATPEDERTGPPAPLHAENSLATALEGGLLGDFRLLGEIGRGGMGVVYEAEQLSLKRKVALKILPLAAALDARQMQRFQNEAQAAAQLHHSHIVPVYAVGCERGIHFYAMQFIHGPTLAAVIRDLRANDEGRRANAERSTNDQAQRTKDRSQEAGFGFRASSFDILSSFELRPSSFFRSVAQLGVQAAEALDYAHQQGVIHRDIKPANLLLEWRAEGASSPVLWITDFGLARLQNDAGPTVTGDLVGTLRYMSPEQALAQRGLVDHRTDVYSLGATLYELVTLQPAFPGTDRQELLRRIAFEEPRPPRQVNRAVPAELETIILKAVAKDPAERYLTAQELADDLRRFLEDKPIRARRPSLVQRLGKWSRRHKPLLAAAGAGLLVALVALTASTVFTWWAYRQEVGRRQQAEQRAFQDLRARNRLYLELTDQQFPRNPRRKQEDDQLFHEAVADYQEFIRTIGTDPAVREEKALACWRLGDFQERLGDRTQAEEAYHQAIALLEALVRDIPDAPGHRQKLAQVLTSLAIVREHQRRFTEAETAHRQALALRRALLTEHPGAKAYREGLAESLTRLGQLLTKTGATTEAEQRLRDALKRQAALVADFPNENKYQGDRADTQHNLGILLWILKRPREAEPLLLQAQQTLRELVDRSFHPIYTVQLAHVHYHLGLLRQEAKRPAEAATVLREAVALNRKLAGAFAWIPEFRQELAASLEKLGEVLADLGQSQEAETTLHEALDLADKLVKDYPDQPYSRQVLAEGRIKLGQILTDTGRSQEGEAVLRQAVTLWQQLATEVPEALDHRKRLANAQLELGKLLEDQGRPREAEACYTTAAAQWESLATAFPQVGSYRQALSVALRRRGQLLQTTGDDLHQAEQVVRRAVILLDQLAADFPAVPEYRRSQALSHTQLAALLAATSRPAETEAAFAQALTLAATLATALPKVPVFRQDLAVVYDQWGRWLMARARPAEAEAKFRQVIALLEKLMTDRPLSAVYPRQLAWLLATCPHPQVRDATRAVALARQVVAQAPKDTSSWSVLGVAQGRAGDWPAALAALKQAVALPGGGDATDHFWLALAHGHVGHAEQAQDHYRSAVRWMEANRPHDPELQRLRAEVEAFLALPAPRPSDSPGPQKHRPG